MYAFSDKRSSKPSQFSSIIAYTCITGSKIAHVAYGCLFQYSEYVYFWAYQTRCVYIDLGRREPFIHWKIENN